METFSAAMAKHGLTVESVFVPYSKSRNFDKGSKVSEWTLNWKVTLKRNGREVITTDYSAGIAHCPSYKQGKKWTHDYTAAIRYECEHGIKATEFGIVHDIRKGKAIEPNPLDVVHCLIMDSSVLDYDSFLDWSRDFGYEDSIKGQDIYGACMRIALKVRNGLGESILSELREASQDY